MARGHELVCLANLHPPPTEPEHEMDSHMYQTVGHEVVSAISECIGVPLIQKAILGKAVDQSRVYREINHAPKTNKEDHDEVEDLFNLISTVKQKYPEIEAVSVGAILSNYQRVRVENVCSRLGLKCLAFLWQYDQRALVDEMLNDIGLRAIICKVAGVGLNKSDLGNDLSEILPKLTELNSKYGANIAGEGGEYETLCLDCPLYKKRIIIEEFDVKIHVEDDGCCEVAYLISKKLRMEPKTDEELAHQRARIRYLLDKDTLELDETRKYPDFDQLNFKEFAASDFKLSASLIKARAPELLFTGKKHTFCLNSVNLHNIKRQASDLEDEAEILFKYIQQELEKNGNLGFQNVTMVFLYLRDMSKFAKVNAVYAKYFGSNHPSCRACISIPGIPGGCSLSIDMYGVNSGVDLEVLHVQSISQWAPANVGPYSQAILEKLDSGSRVVIAGQIGLVPSSMVFAADARSETEISIRHVQRVSGVFLNNKQIASDKSELTKVMRYCICYIDRPSKALPYAVEEMKPFAKLPNLICSVETLPKNGNVEWLVELVPPEAHSSSDFHDKTELKEEQGFSYSICPNSGAALFTWDKSGGFDLQRCLSVLPAKFQRNNLRAVRVFLDANSDSSVIKKLHEEFDQNLCSVGPCYQMWRMDQNCLLHKVSVGLLLDTLG